MKLTPLNFTKDSNKVYHVTIPEDLANYIHGIAADLSLNKYDEFYDITNLDLENTLYARYIAAEFVKSNNSYNSLGWTIVLVKTPITTIKISVGKLEDKNKGVKILSWVMYD